MTEGVKRVGREAYRHGKTAWDWGKFPLAITFLIATSNQFLDLKGKYQAQQQREQTTASAVAAVMKDIGSLSAEVDKVSMRVSRLERPSRRLAGVQRGTASPDTVAASSPGFIKSAGAMLAAPAKVFWGGVRSLFGGG